MLRFRRFIFDETIADRETLGRERQFTLPRDREAEQTFGRQPNSVPGTSRPPANVSFLPHPACISNFVSRQHFTIACSSTAPLQHTIKVRGQNGVGIRPAGAADFVRVDKATPVRTLVHGDELRVPDSGEETGWAAAVFIYERLVESPVINIPDDSPRHKPPVLTPSQAEQLRIELDALRRSHAQQTAELEAARRQVQEAQTAREQLQGAVSRHERAVEAARREATEAVQQALEAQALVQQERAALSAAELRHRSVEEVLHNQLAASRQQLAEEYKTRGRQEAREAEQQAELDALHRRCLEHQDALRSAQAAHAAAEAELRGQVALVEERLAGALREREESDASWAARVEGLQAEVRTEREAGASRAATFEHQLAEARTQVEQVQSAGQQQGEALRAAEARERELRDELGQRTAELESERGRYQTDTKHLQAEAAKHQAEACRLQTEVERLEGELAHLKAEEARRNEAAVALAVPQQQQRAGREQQVMQAALQQETYVAGILLQRHIRAAASSEGAARLLVLLDLPPDAPPQKVREEYARLAAHLAPVTGPLLAAAAAGGQSGEARVSLSQQGQAMAGVLAVAVEVWEREQLRREEERKREEEARRQRHEAIREKQQRALRVIEYIRCMWNLPGAHPSKFFWLLGLCPSKADATQLEAACRNLLKVLHPDLSHLPPDNQQATHARIAVQTCKDKCTQLLADPRALFKSFAPLTVVPPWLAGQHAQAASPQAASGPAPAPGPAAATGLGPEVSGPEQPSKKRKPVHPDVPHPGPAAPGPGHPSGPGPASVDPTTQDTVRRFLAHLHQQQQQARQQVQQQAQQQQRRRQQAEQQNEQREVRQAMERILTCLRQQKERDAKTKWLSFAAR